MKTFLKLLFTALFAVALIFTAFAQDEMEQEEIPFEELSTEEQIIALKKQLDALSWISGFKLSGEAKSGLYWRRRQTDGEPAQELITLHSMDDAANRKNMAAHIRQAAQHEQQACEALGNIIDHFVMTMENDAESLQTVKGFPMPLRIDTTLMTSGGEFRVHYLMGAILIGKGFCCDYDILTGEYKMHKDKKALTFDTFTDFTWIIQKTSMKFFVNGELYHHRDDMPYMDIITKASSVMKTMASVRISACRGSTITVKSLKATQL